jgi:DNA modification methylase
MAVTVFQGDCRVVAATLPAEWFHCVVTSIPYWGLRAYGTEPQVWGGDSGCAHEWGGVLSSRRRGQAAGETAQVGNTTKRVCPPELQQGAFCIHCRAWLGELGSEPSLSLFVAHVVEVFRAIRRTMRADSTLWLNVGDCYATTPNGRSAADTKRFGADDRTFRDKPVGTVVDGLKPKDLAMAPARVALALQEDGWLLRSQIVWTKLAPMPESLGGTHWERCRVKTVYRPDVRDGTIAGRARDGAAIHFDYRQPQGSEWADCSGCPKCAATDGLVLHWDSGRPTTATEMVYLFAVGQRYFYDLEAVRVPVSAATLADGRTERGQRGTKGQYAAIDGNAGFNPAGRNLWNYWMLGSEPSREEHYAAYPAELVRRCLAAGTSERGCCPTCGAPWARVIEQGPSDWPERRLNGASRGSLVTGANAVHGVGTDHTLGRRASRTTGWRPTCACPDAPPIPCRVLDPFGGSGTTGLVADQMGRDCALVELKPEYAQMAERRINRDAPLLTTVTAAPAPEGRQLALFPEAGNG